MSNNSVDFKAHVDGTAGITDVRVKFNGALQRPDVTYVQKAAGRNKKPLSVPLQLQNGDFNGSFKAFLDVGLRIDGVSETTDGKLDDVMFLQTPDNKLIVDVIIDPGTPAYEALSKKLGNNKSIKIDVFGDKTPDFVVKGSTGVIHVILGVKNQTLP